VMCELRVGGGVREADRGSELGRHGGGGGGVLFAGPAREDMMDCLFPAGKESTV
jgi:hypothetical protein